MDKLTRRSLLRTLAGGALTTLGTVVIARATVAEAAEAMGGGVPLPGDLKDRATRLAANLGSEEMTSAPAQLFLNGGVPGIFGNAPFGNAPFGNFGNGGFRNGGFRNGGFRNGGFRNGGFRNGFRNY
jgi:hypothetical protein